MYRDKFTYKAHDMSEMTPTTPPERVVDAATALMAHTEAAGVTLEKFGISIRIAPIAYEGALS